MRLKDGVRWPEDMHPSTWYARSVIDVAHREATGYGATCTSAYRDQSPGGSSLHPKKRAMDVRVWAFPTDQQVRDFAKALRDRLGPDFDVVVEGQAAEHERYRDRPPHIHVEYDPKAWG